MSGMQTRDIHDAFNTLLAVGGDALAILAGGMLAIWVRFDSGWLPLPFGRDPDLYVKYGLALLTVLPLYLFAFLILRLYHRPQEGAFANRVPRLIRACGIGMLLVLLLNAIMKNYVEFSNGVILIGFPLMALVVLFERGVLFRAELALARRAGPNHRVLILGADDMAVRLWRGLTQDPRRRSEVAGIVPSGVTPPHADVPEALRLDPGLFAALDGYLDAHPEIDQVILTPDHPLSHDQVIALILNCERRMLHFTMVPDLFRVLTAGMALQTIQGVPVLGTRQWPLDRFWNRLLKRVEDVAVAFPALMLSAPFMAVFAWRIRRESPGPALYRQERYGRHGKCFTLYKLRTMHVDAERDCGPVFTQPDDPRTTPFGAWLRRNNLDELPQLWNVVKGDMSLVGPRPERPFFVEQFRDDIARYMWRHVSRPGITGWAQVNGLRGDTSIAERIKFDLYYLEHWSLAFDLKILLRTLCARKNAY